MVEARGLRGLVAPSLMALVLAGCGGGGDEAPAEGGSPAAGAVIEHPVDAATAGSIRGTVKFTGTAPAAEKIDMSDEPTCASSQGANAVRHTVMVGADGGLGNVFVYVKEGLDPALKFPAGEQVVLDQQGCEYRPHVMGLTAGESLKVKNSDALLHNINATPTLNRGFNRSQPQQNMEFDVAFTTPEVMIPVRCDVHGWMEAYIGVTAHPYRTVTPEAGTFTLDRLPAGTYTLEAWHEKYGTQTQVVVVPASGMVDVAFTFDASMAGRPVPMGPELVLDMHAGTARRASQQ